MSSWWASWAWAKPRLPPHGARHGRGCVDVDAFLERKHGRSAAELFGELGEDALRELEYEALVECANMGPSLISCGEGIVAYDKSRELLKRRGFAVMLESSEATSLGRIHNLSTRPLLAHDCDIEGLWEQRKPLYEEVARAKINVQGRSTGSVAGFVAKVLARAGRLYARFRRCRREENRGRLP